MEKLRITGPKDPVHGAIHIAGSKSISNRALMIRALSGDEFNIQNLSDSDDTRLLDHALSNPGAEIWDVHHAGTSFRFLSAYLAIQEDTQILTGSSRMKERPIKELVNALRDLGADIDYLEKVGFPPLRINAFRGQKNKRVKLKADVSSQFISALCMIAPVLDMGLEIELEGELVSKPYLDMTLGMMAYFGVPSQFTDGLISVEPGRYGSRDFVVESDWSSASYHYGICAILPGSRIALTRFSGDSLQGDAAISSISEAFGVRTQYTDDGIVIHSALPRLSHFEYDFIAQPDLFQTVAAMSAATGVTLRARGLKTLALKESDRTTALANELAKSGLSLKKPDEAGWEVELNGNIHLNEPAFDTYRDHRMAMSLSLLSCLGSVIIHDPQVVSKSYPRYWQDLEKLGFYIEGI